MGGQKLISISRGAIQNKARSIALALPFRAYGLSMKTLDFARAQIRFDKSSPITGPFRDEFLVDSRFLSW
jgi:hypothetical protein